MPDGIEAYAAADRRFRSDLSRYCSDLVYIQGKEGRVETFVWNRAQRHVHEQIERQKELTGRVRALVLKARQLGMSTYVASRFYHKTTLAPGLGQNTYILTHEDRATQNLFGMVKRVHDNMDPAYKLRLKAANTNELAFARTDSGYRVGTAKNVAGAGRSLTLQNFHGSEVAFWPNAEVHIGGVMQAIPDARGTEIILESTANGVTGVFYEMWQQAEKGEGGFIPIFAPWYWSEEYRKPVGSGFVPSDDEIEYQELYGLDDEQLFWLHDKNIELRGSAGEICWLFRQEYPATAQEAFQTSGDDSLIKPQDVVRARLADLPTDEYAPKILGVDVAGGGGDKTRFIDRQGRSVGKRVNVTLDTDDLMVVANRVALLQQEHGFDRIFVDKTGMGWGVVNRLHELGFNTTVSGVNFGSVATKEDEYVNKRSEMWGELALWLRDGADIPDDDTIHRHLCGPTYEHDARRRMALEQKRQIKKRLKFSPDGGDAIALTFAEIVVKEEPRQPGWVDQHGGGPKDFMTS